MKDKIVIISIVALGLFAFVLFFGFVLSNVDPDNKLEGYTLAISFIGVFATFGGAYLGAKIAGDNASKLFERRMNIQSSNDRNKLIIRIRLSLDYIIKYIHHISGQYSNVVLSNFIYINKHKFLNENYTVKAKNKNFKNDFYNLTNKKPNDYIEIPEKVKIELNLFSNLIENIIMSNEIVELNEEEQKQLFMFKQVLSNIDNQIKRYNGKNVIEVYNNEVEEQFLKYFVQLNVLLVDVQNWVLEQRT